MGYLLNDNTIGVLFNDRSSFVKLGDNQVIWIERVRVQGKEKTQVYFEHKIPFTLQYKFQIFKEIEAQLFPYKKGVKKQAIIDENARYLFYLYKWQREQSCVMFRMSTNLIQANFKDKTLLWIDQSGSEEVVSYQVKLSPHFQVSKL